MNNAIKIFFLLLLLTLSLGATLMTSSIPSVIVPSSRFAGSFDVVSYTNEVIIKGFASRVSRKVTPCHNLATARAYVDGRLPVASAARTVAPLSDEQRGGCVRGGAGYDAAVTWLATGRVERVSNWATAGALTRNFPVTA